MTRWSCFDPEFRLETQFEINLGEDSLPVIALRLALEIDHHGWLILGGLAMLGLSLALIYLWAVMRSEAGVQLRSSGLPSLKKSADKTARTGPS